MKAKIVHVITGLGDGGAEAVLVRLCKNSHDFEHVVISLTGAGKYGKVLEDLDIKLYFLNAGFSLLSLLNLLKLPILLKQEKPDIVQTWMYHADLVGGIAAKLAGIRRISWGIRRSSLKRKNTKLFTIVIAYLCALLSRWIPNVIVCCSNKTRTTHVKIGYDPSKMVIIQNGYDLSFFYPSSCQRLALRKALDIGDNTFLIGNVSRYDYNKDHNNLLKALNILSQRNLDFICLLIGANIVKENNILSQSIANLDLKEKIILLGQRDDIPAIMNSIDIHVLSSRSEGFPNVVAEAMACGTVSISTNVGDASEIVDTPESICAIEDPISLANAILKVAHEWQEGERKWQQRKQNCSKKIKTKFDLATMVKLYERVWLDS